MPKVLHILTKSEDATVLNVIANQRENARLEVRAVDLNATSPDYAALVRQIFEADQVIVW